MRIAAALPWAAVAAAFVLPDANVFSDLEVRVKHGQGKVASWWERVPSKESVLSAAEDAYDFVSHSVQDAISTGKDRIEHLIEDEMALAEEEFEDIINNDDDAHYDLDDALDKPKHGHRRKPHKGHKKPKKTIWELISESKYTTKLAKLVGEYDDLVEALNTTSANYTLFAPVDGAFKGHHGGHKKPSKEVVKKILQYHVVPGLNPARRIIYRHTLPTALEGSGLGGHAQRLRVRVGLRGVRVNFYSKVIAANIPATNGVIHGVNRLLIPPPNAGKLISLFPQRFSTLLLAFEKTDFVSYIHGVPMSSGATVFAPTNGAFTRLGPKANAFLFNTETGAKFLKAILKYHIVANQTLYSDAYYGGKKEEEEEFGLERTGAQRYHVDLTTLLGEKSVAVDVVRWGGFIRVRLNGYVPVVLQDGIAKNGVIQVVGRVLIPPHKHGKKGEVEEVDGEISVEELKERLAGYVEDDGGDDDDRGDL